jgi:hypothetical protein
MTDTAGARVRGRTTLFNMKTKSLIFCSMLLIPCFAQQQRTPDLEAQRVAMKKLAFLVGKWRGEARLQRGSGEPMLLTQTEEVEFKVDGLVLLTEGIGRAEVDGRPILQALGILSYDDEAGKYHMRAFNDGRFLETEVKFLENGKGITWGFVLARISHRGASKKPLLLA